MKNKLKFIHNAKVLWSNGSNHQRIPSMYDKSWALCKWWINKHKNDPQYAKGKLIIVSMLDKELISN